MRVTAMLVGAVGCVSCGIYWTYLRPESQNTWWGFLFLLGVLAFGSLWAWGILGPDVELRQKLQADDTEVDRAVRRDREAIELRIREGSCGCHQCQNILRTVIQHVRSGGAA